ncbi:bifunctional hydroxymethylpyrimidine kinase/phosphomethylpyrimidine kinase [uncultured Pseudodesulfovibrio sp.]|uniref:bifunctional hydroxymethylpyrimidine kinase/phosphomethylpyrimidine kinase n=1 Tax=uncultured Pseudodesulfovibrio sp. TaxID=2035858 RepID=UPI0029C69219|nr:bifunctional hydroxymethylpyrimidine kinase/phosphomethylpyrimidine kinase [uncultured Pseudodesulfovibrio sp.]
MNKLPCVLTIAGSDSGGGAGIQADLKAITMLGGYGASVITALTAQNTKAVTGIHAPSAKFVAQQLRTVLDDIEVSAAKTGMLFSASIIKALAPILSHKKFPLVVDPVCVATSGAKLLKDDAVEAMVQLIFPCADLLTPNIPEAELFTGVKIQDRDDVFKAARILLEMGPKAVLIKGGHSDSFAVTDWYFTKGADPIPFMQQRVDTNCTHGTGCTLSAAIATGLGQGIEMGAAIMRAQEYLNLALRAGYPLGEGGGPPNHLAPLLKERERGAVLAELDRFGRRLVGMSGVKALLPRVGINVAASLPWAAELDDVAGFSGGIIGTRRGDVLLAGYPEFGASVYTASTLLAVKRLRPDIGCALTLGLGAGVKQALEMAGFEIAWVDRDRRPEYIIDEDGRFEEWAVFEALRDHSAPETVRAIGDPGGVGRESLVRLLAKDMSSLQAALCRILDCIHADNDV